MAQAGASVNVPATPEQVWQVIGGFGSLPDWLPYIPKSELSEGGRVRHLASPNGETDDQLLSKMKRGSYIVDTARAQICDRDAIVGALESGQLTG